ncbi:hypothetical protein niasHT_009390 [Heterodera trifolii]|uniref:Uncharacterized protein n=1 Tax=Heterodera trifolii TaxID=157864 RepID=A0ABD2M4T3_9BILA
MASRYDHNGFGSMSFSLHNERASPRFVSATSRHYPGSSDRLHRFPSPSSTAAAAMSSSSPRFVPLSLSPRVSPVPSSTSTYTPKRSVSYTSGLSLGEGGGGERRYNSYSSSWAPKRTSIGGASNGIPSGGSLVSNASSVYDPSSSSVYRRSPSSSYHRNTHFNTYSSPLSSSNRLIYDSVTSRFEHGILSSVARNLPVRPSPLAVTSRSAGNSPPDSPPSKGIISLITREEGEKEKHFPENFIDRNKGNERAATDDDLSREKIGTDALSEKRSSVSPHSRDSSPKNYSKGSPSKTQTKSPPPLKSASSVCDSASPPPISPVPFFASSQISRPSSGGLFTQLEKMIKMSNFDQGKFQKHVRSAVQQNETRETEESPTKVQKVRKSQAEKRRSLSEVRKSPAKKERRNASECPQNALEKTKAHSESLSPAPNLRRAKKKEEEAEERGSDASQKRGKRWARRARTVENLMDELQRGEGTGQMTPEGKKQLNSARNSPSREYSAKAQQQRHQLLRAVPPLLLVTRPSMGAGDEDELPKAAENNHNINSEDGTEAEATAVLTLTGPEGEEDNTEESSYDEDEEEYSDEEYTDEEEWESDEGEWDEATVSRTLQLSGHESDFEFPFALGPSAVDKDNSNVLAPPPIFTASISYDGMSDSWGGRSYSDEGTTNSTSYTEPSGDEVEVGFTLVQQCAMRGSDEEFTSSSSTSSGSYTSGTYTSSSSMDEDEEEEEEEDEEVEEEEVSGDEHGSRPSSRAVSPSHRSRSASSTSSSGESAESVCSEEEQQKPAEETELKAIVEDEEKPVATEEISPIAQKGPSPMFVQMAEESEQMLEGHATVEELDGEEMNMEELEEVEEEQSIEGNKEICREETYVRVQELRDGRTEEAARPLTGQSKPRTDFAKKAVVQPMRQEKLSVTEQKTLLAPDEQKIREEEERKRKMEEEKKRKEEEERKRKEEEEKKRKEEEEKKRKEEEIRKRKMEEEKKRKEGEEKKRKVEEEERKQKLKQDEEEKKAKKKAEEEERKRKVKEEEQRKKALSEDKSAQRKSTLNMREEERIKAEQAEKESARQKARATGAVEEKSKQYTTTKTEDSLAYKRSKALEPKTVDEQKKRTFQPIQKPDPKAEEAFEKQMAELREQMRQGSRKLQSEFRDVSQGLKSASDEAKLKTKEERHRTVMDKASSAFGKAEQERRRQREQQESEAERAKREKEERESKEREKREKEKKSAQAAQTAKTEPKRTVRRAAKETAPPQSEDAKKGEEGAATKTPSKIKAYWERGARRKTEELMKFKEAPTVGQTKTKEEQQTKKEERGTTENERQKKGEGEEGQQQRESKTTEKKANRRKNRRRNTRHGHRRRPFTRAPFDIDELMEWHGLDTFERMEAFFASRGAEKRPLTSPTDGTAPKAKRRGTEAQKVWISELRDIDKLYKASELRDIKLSAGA